MATPGKQGAGGRRSGRTFRLVEPPLILGSPESAGPGDRYPRRMTTGAFESNDHGETTAAEGTPSEGPSGMGDLETSGGGADAVPDTPDALPPHSPGAGVVSEA